MVYSYLGLSKPIDTVNKFLTKLTVDYRRANGLITPPLTPGGVFSNNLTETANFAASADMAVYTRAEDVFKKSDIIFAFVPDKALKNLASSLKGHGIREKIICHCSDSFDAKVLDFDSSNTYVSFFVPQCSVTDDMTYLDNIWAEGYGSRFDEVFFLAKMFGIRLTELKAGDKEMFLAAQTVLTQLPSFVESISKEVMQKALRCPDDAVSFIVDKTKESNNIAPAGNTLELVRKQKENMLSLGMDDAAALLSALLTIHNHRRE